MKNDNTLAGRVIQVKRRNFKSGNTSSRGEILTQGEVFPFFFESLDQSIKLGDYVVLQGNWKQVNGSIAFVSSNMRGQATPKSMNSKLLDHVARGINPQSMGLLTMRSIAESEIHHFLRLENFIPVSSPTLVSDWIMGQTGSFRASFYESENCNLTISNLIYHQMNIINGMTRIYELGKLFRKETPSTRKRLAEFTILDISLANSTLETLMEVFNSALQAIHKRLLLSPLQNSSQLITLPAQLSFDKIDYRDLLIRSGVGEISGHQLPSKVAQYLDANFQSFVWVTGFPEHTRPFYTKSNPDRHCIDAQLWYQGKIYVGAGGECETDLDRIVKKIKNEGKDPTAFSFYLSSIEFGMPETCGMTLGIERVLAAWLGNATTAADFAYFPRYRGNFIP